MSDDDNAQARKDAKILAEARRIRDDDERSRAARELAREKGKKTRKPDVFAGKGSLAGGLRARRQAVESEDLEGAPAAFEEGIQNDRR